MTTQTTSTIIYEGIGKYNHEYRVTEAINADWQPSRKPLYFVERNQGSHDPRFFCIYIGEDKAHAMSLAQTR